MDAVSSLSNANQTATTASSRGFSELAGEDFFQLLISQITNQDPLEPTGNEELLNQISSIRDIELTTSMTESMKALSGQQQYSAASTLIGRFVTGPVSEDGAQISGAVVGARFEADGRAILQLATGDELPLDQVTGVQTAERVGAALVGKHVQGVDTREPSDPKVFEGLVTAVRADETGDLLLELDTGGAVRLSDVSAIGATDMPAEEEEEDESVLGGLAGKATQAIRKVIGGLLG